MKKTTLFSMISFICILSITIGFASFQNNLEIDNIGVTVRYKKDIRVTSVLIDSSSNATTEYLNYNISNINGRIDLPTTSSHAIYKMTITNIGNIDQGVLRITGLTSSLKYQIVGCDNNAPYELGIESINANGNKKDICIKIMPNGSSYSGNFVVNTDFRAYHNISYSNFEDTTDYPTRIMDGSTTLTLNTGDDFQISTGQGIMLEKNVDYNFFKAFF